jgi:hypothetical protein
MHTKFWLESLKGRDHFEGLDIDGRIVATIKHWQSTLAAASSCITGLHMW